MPDDAPARRCSENSGARYATFNQIELARLELTKILHIRPASRQLRGLLRPLARQQHPQILHRRPHAAFVKSTKCGAGIGPQTSLAWQSPCSRRPRPRPRAHSSAARHPTPVAPRRVIRLEQGAGSRILPQSASGSVAKALPCSSCGATQCGAVHPVHKCGRENVRSTPARTHVPAPHPSATSFKQGKTEIAILMQVRPSKVMASTTGISPPTSSGDKRMLFKNLRIAPASGTVKFGHQRRRIFHADLVDPVFITIQRQQASTGRTPRLSTASSSVSGVKPANGGVRSLIAPIINAKTPAPVLFQETGAARIEANLSARAR